MPYYFLWYYLLPTSLFKSTKYFIAKKRQPILLFTGSGCFFSDSILLEYSLVELFALLSLEKDHIDNNQIHPHL